MLAPERFRSLASLLAPAADLCEPPAAAAVAEAQPGGEVREAIDDAVRDVRIFRAQLRETVDRAVETIVCDIAAEVLARELLLEPADIQAIVHSAMQRYASAEPVALRVSPSDARSVDCELPVVEDASLRSGDAVLQLRDGTIDVSLGVRLDAVLRSIA